MPSLRPRIVPRYRHAFSRAAVLLIVLASLASALPPTTADIPLPAGSEIYDLQGTLTITKALVSGNCVATVPAIAVVTYAPVIGIISVQISALDASTIPPTDVQIAGPAAQLIYDAHTSCGSTTGGDALTSVTRSCGGTSLSLVLVSANWQFSFAGSSQSPSLCLNDLNVYFDPTPTNSQTFAVSNVEAPTDVVACVGPVQLVLANNLGAITAYGFELRNTACSSASPPCGAYAPLIPQVIVSCQAENIAPGLACCTTLSAPAPQQGPSSLASVCVSQTFINVDLNHDGTAEERLVAADVTDGACPGTPLVPGT